MNNIIDLAKLFGNEINACRIDDCAQIADLVRKYITRIDKYIESFNPYKENHYKNTCYLFLRSIVDYAKASSDSFYLGHFSTTNIINRTIIENYVCLKALLQHEILWKYWYVHSLYNTPLKYVDDPSEVDEKLIQIWKSKCDEYEVDPAFIKIIRKDYSWVYPVCKDTNFKALCDIISPGTHSDYKMMCEFTHGTSFFQKEDPHTFISSQLNSLSILFTYVYLALVDYCPNFFDKEADSLEQKIRRYYRRVQESNETE